MSVAGSATAGVHFCAVSLTKADRKRKIRPLEDYVLRLESTTYYAQLPGTTLEVERSTEKIRSVLRSLTDVVLVLRLVCDRPYRAATAAASRVHMMSDENPAAAAPAAAAAERTLEGEESSMMMAVQIRSITGDVFDVGISSDSTVPNDCRRLLADDIIVLLLTR